MKFIKALKRQKFYYYLKHILIYATPKVFYQIHLKKWLTRNSKEIDDRIKYYVSPNINVNPDKKWISIANFKIPKKGTMYFFDSMKVAKYFEINKKINFAFGDITQNFNAPTLVKSRPINHNGNSVLMKLDSLRHFYFIDDDRTFLEKNDKIVWRGTIHKENRRLLVDMFYNHPFCDIGDVSHVKWDNPNWKKRFLSIKEQLASKFVLSIEGVDVATNLKWIMSSNSLCFMPKPQFETWYMEGKLIPDYHYVLIEDDYSNLLEKRAYYLENQNEALTIIKNAHRWTHQFRNRSVEKEISIKVLNQFFKQTNQN
ncbi:Glycosyl transferase family 90 [Tenacibaculum sp. MAR_2009_124]|uniref:glycosyl transferase family 90 n=1 Tax=Tenacibaculum sp. MAR_2009_124 TaxID=1250059 RepID=UPI00089D7CBC|nr:glycosyl transferase family 90 [Tenacibaculum sp. MAR_2009_124]SEB42754.1 Glycosyl transferase family 90 [Tenacibaculum sp. MAR_2009_124]